MLTTKQKVLRRFWHAIMPMEHLRTGPKPFRLLGEDIVLFLDGEGKPAALRDRCCHRTSKLSKGWSEGGQIVCGYHGWTYDRDGFVTRIPQFEPGTKLPNYRTTPYHCQERYGYAWVALDDPLEPIFDIPEDADAKFRRIPQFYTQWQTAALRVMENSFDNAHFSFVHKGTFGNIAKPVPGRYSLEETERGFYGEAVSNALNPEAGHQITGWKEPEVERMLRSSWYLPFGRRFDMEYPSGIRHIIISYATPMEDKRIQFVQWLYRNDTEADCPAQKLVDWDAAIIAEDKEILESTDEDVMLDASRTAEVHMPTDRPSMIIRRRLLEFLHSHGEQEVTRDALV
jgi:phenylpropionate dioxygenase-like ring-hydroxylating dioxygenase large terminal subunit